MTHARRSGHTPLGIIALALLLASCSSQSTISTATPIPTPAAPTVSSATGTPTAIPPSATPAGPSVRVLAGDLAGPDDLLLAPDGSIYISDVNDGTIRTYSPAGQLHTLLSGLSEPEGMLLMPDGSLIIAEQGRNRLLRYDATTGALTPFLSLHNSTGQAGVDGLAFDAVTQTIIVPDSPNGTVLRVGLDGRLIGVLARGFARPTGAWVEADGSLLVVDENGNSLNRLHPEGKLEKLADLPTPDDVVEDAAGNIFASCLGDGAIHLISATTGQDRTLLTGLLDPQGLVLDSDGNLILTDAGHHQLLKLILH